MEQELEYSFNCPYCWQKVSFVFDLLSGSQKYIEDCEVCCQPIEVEYFLEDGEIVSFDSRKAN
jgi:transcription elongation factor Elf1